MPTPRKLTDKQRTDIRGFLSNRTYTVLELAAMYRVSDTTIRTLLPADRRRGPRPAQLQLTGQTFGSWKVLGRSTERSNRVNRHTYWRCECACGGVYPVQGVALVSGRSKQCVPCRLASAKGRPQKKKKKKKKKKRKKT